MLYKLLWLFLQFCMTVYETLQWLSWRLQIVNRSYDRRHKSNTEASLHCDRIFLQKCKSELTKIPRHLSIIIGHNEQVDDELISRILVYALEMSIDCVSLYDTRPDEKQNIDLQKLQPPKDIYAKEFQKSHLLWTTTFPTYDVAHAKLNGSVSNSHKSGTENGYRNHSFQERSIKVYKITPDDGHSLIADVCRDLFVRRRNSDVQALLQNRSHLTQVIDEELSSRLFKSKDPELCLIFNEHMCTFGMLPWQTRFTEFHLHQRGLLFDAESFAKILYRYSRCEQRWGK